MQQLLPDEKAKVTIDYGQGKKVNYEISVHRVEEQILPDLNLKYSLGYLYTFVNEFIYYKFTILDYQTSLDPILIYRN